MVQREKKNFQKSKKTQKKIFFSGEIIENCGKCNVGSTNVAQNRYSQQFRQNLNTKNFLYILKNHNHL